MILEIRHRGLRRLYEDDGRRGLNPKHVNKIRRVLAMLERVSKPEDMDLPGYRLHRLKGGLAGFWSVMISGNWRIIFRFDDGHITDVDYLDYH